MGGKGVVTCPWQMVRLGAAANRQEGAGGAVTPLERGVTVISSVALCDSQWCASLPGGR